MKKVLFISGSLGLGHAARDLAIAGELRKTNPDLEILWMAEDPAITFLESWGEKVIPITGVKGGSTDICDAHGGSYHLYLAEVWLDWIKTFPERVALFREVAKREKVDLVIGDETFDIFTEFTRHPELKDFRFVLIQDFLGIHHVKKDPRQVIAGLGLQPLVVQLPQGSPPLGGEYLHRRASGHPGREVRPVPAQQTGDREEISRYRRVHPQLQPRRVPGTGRGCGVAWDMAAGP